MPRVALSARVSTDRQAEHQTIEQQLERLQAEAQQWEWAIRPAQIDRDDGVSGARLDRPALDRLRDAIGQRRQAGAEAVEGAYREASRRLSERR